MELISVAKHLMYCLIDLTYSLKLNIYKMDVQMKDDNLFYATSNYLIFAYKWFQFYWYELIYLFTH